VSEFSPDQPFGKKYADESKNVVVPGAWFNCVNRALGMMTIVEDLETGEDPHVSVDPLFGILQLHFRNTSTRVKFAWAITLLSDELAKIEPQSILMVNQKPYFLDGYLGATPAIKGTITNGAGVAASGLDPHTVDISSTTLMRIWVRLEADGAGGDAHEATLCAGANWPNFEPATSPLYFWRPVGEISIPEGERPFITQHATGHIVIDIP